MLPSLTPYRSPVPPAARFSGMRLTLRDLAPWRDNPADAPYESLQSLMIGTLGDDEVLLTIPGDSSDGPQQTLSLGKSPALGSLVVPLKAGEPFHKIWESWLERLKRGELTLATPRGENVTLPNGMTAEEVLLKAFQVVVPVISDAHGGERKEFNGPGNSWRAVYIVPRPPKRAQREKAAGVSQDAMPATVLSGPKGLRGLLQRFKA